jgi:protein involved in polysaccharide export with SLBB domain
MVIYSKVIFCVLSHLIFAAILFSQTSIPENILPPKYVNPENLIHLGDIVDVDFVGSTEFDWRGTLNPDGFLDQIGYSNNPVNALCRSEESVAKDIANLFSNTLKNPNVVVKILDRSNRSISYILGAIKTPQRLRIKRAIRLSELIILSGGITENASGDVQLLRPANVSCESAGTSETEILNVRLSDILRGDQNANPAIRLGDIISVKETQPIFVTGGVRNPRQIFFRDKITLSRAIDSAGGLTSIATVKQITIYRRMGKTSSTILVDYSQILTKKFQDIELQKYDIIEVGTEGGGSLTPRIVQNFYENPSENANLPLRIIE